MSEQEFNQTGNVESSIEDTVNGNSHPPKDKNRSIFKEPIFILNALAALFLFLILLLHYPSKPKPIIWEYKTVKFLSQGYDRTGSEAGKFATVQISEDKLNEIGQDGWELVSATLEMETSYPNFGNSSYVTGLQPNVRPQGLICIFKKPLTHTK